MKRSFPIDRLMLDITTTLLIFFAALFAIDAVQEKARKNQSHDAISGPEKHILIECEWSQELDIDIDLWVKGPADTKPVGYSRTNDMQTSYLRDDKGTSNDLSAFNYEVASIRALVPGIYVVNVHWFGNFADAPKVPVKVRASLSAAGRAAFIIASTDLVLVNKGEERTAFTFEIDGSGNFIEGSVAKNYIPLRNVPNE